MGSKAWDIFREILSEKKTMEENIRHGNRRDMRWLGRKKWVGHGDRSKSRSKDLMIQPGKEKNKQKHRQ